MKKFFNVTFKHVNRLSESWRIMLQTILLRAGYLKDVLGDMYRSWSNERAIIFNCQAGSGKTTCFEDVLVPRAIALGKKAVIVSNRLALSIAEKKRIMKKFHIENVWNDAGLKKQCFFGDHIIICTYQKLAILMADPKFADDIEYLIMDECHYFIADSGFSTTPSYLLKKIPQFFKDSKRIYISATTDEVLPYICKYECMAGSVRYKIKYGWMPNYNSIFNIPDIELRKQEISRTVYAPSFPTPILYQMPEDYGFVNIHFFEDETKLVNKINSSSDKWLIFVTSKVSGEKLSAKIKGSFFIDTSSKESEGAYFEKLIDEECFENKVLISTSVFINGNNLIDENLRNIVIYQLDETSIKQGLGRKRIPRGSNEKLELYLKIPNKKTLNQYLKSTEDVLEIATKSENDPSHLSKFLLSNAHNVEMVKRMLYADKNGILHFGDLCLEKMKNDTALFQNMLLLLQEGVVEYCKEIANYLGQDLNEDMMEMLESKDEVLADFAKAAIKDSPMSEQCYKEYIEDFNIIRKKYKLLTSKDNLGAKRPLMSPKVFNDRAEGLGINLKVIKEEELYVFYNIDADNVTT